MASVGTPCGFHVSHGELTVQDRTKLMENEGPPVPIHFDWICTKEPNTSRYNHRTLLDLPANLLPKFTDSKPTI